jgi:hypothetical protein
MAVDNRAGGVARGPYEGAGRPASARLSGHETAEMILAKYGVLIAFVVMIVVFSLARSGSFPTWENAKSILTAAAPMFAPVAGGRPGQLRIAAGPGVTSGVRARAGPFRGRGSRWQGSSPRRSRRGGHQEVRAADRA